MPTEIILFEDNDQLRSSLVMLLNSSGDYNVTGNYRDCKKADYYVLRDEPGVVIMDIDLPGKTGIEGVRMIKEANPGIFVIMYTMFEDDDKIFQSLCAGANGYILKRTAPDKLTEAIEEVLSGGAPMSPAIAKKVLNSFRDDIKHIDYHLSPREKELLQLLVKGYLVKNIADELNIAFNTARSHLKNIYAKLHVNCGKEAISKVLRERIL